MTNCRLYDGCEMRQAGGVGTGSSLSKYCFNNGMRNETECPYITQLNQNRQQSEKIQQLETQAEKQNSNVGWKS